MPTKLYLKVGQSYRTNTPFKGDVDFQKEVGNVLNRFHIPFSDPCCPSVNSSSVNATGTISSLLLSRGIVTSTSAAPTTITLPTATALARQIKAGPGTWFDFTVDNIAGASLVTVAVGVGITTMTPVITGGATLTVAAGTVGFFKVYFNSITAAKIARVI